ncbi:zinc-binding dehydrogenase [Streptomyces olivaceoviridis]|uniref:zinc-dependent alcohol dehydrogenase n=1 Tax=Streptomyces olivaceoviridis TaxID=1921 RepID=UPI003694D285
MHPPGTTRNPGQDPQSRPRSTQYQVKTEAAEQTSINEFPLGPPPPGHLTVRVRETGVCGSDVTMWAGRHAVLKPPMVLGHETWGTVEELAGDLSPDLLGYGPGTPVVVVPPAGCGTCYNCVRGREQLCADMRFVGAQLDGGMARFLTVPPAHVLPVDPVVPTGQRVLIEPLAVAVHAVGRARLRPDDQVVVIGAGPIGVLSALVAATHGVGTVVIADRDPHRLDLARRLGLQHRVRTTGSGLLADCRGSIRPEGADVVLDCVGAQATTRMALDTACRGGRVVLVGISPPELTVDGVQLQRGERELIGVQMYVRADFGEAMRLLADGMLPAVDGLKRSRPLAQAGVLLAELAERPSPVLKETLLPG